MVLIGTCGLFLLCAITLSLASYRTIATPMVSYFAVYMIVAAAFVGLSRAWLGVLQLDALSDATSVLLYSSFAAFFAGSALTCGFKQKRPSIAYWTRKRQQRLLRWTRTVAVMGLAGALVVEFTVVRHFGNPLTSTMAARDALSAGTFVINPFVWLLFYANIASLADWTILGVLVHPRYLKFALGTLGMAWLVGNSLGLGGITLVLVAVLGSVYIMCQLYRGRNTFVAHKILIGGAAMLALLTLNANLRSANHLENVETTVILHDGLYIGGVLPALQDAIVNPPAPLYPGFWTFPAFYHYANMISGVLWHESIYSVNDINHEFNIELLGGLPTFFNSCPAIGWWYAEGGFTFAVILSFVLGWYMGWIFDVAVRTGAQAALEIGAISWAYLILTYRSGFILDDPWVFTWVMVLLGRRWLLAW